MSLRMIVAEFRESIRPAITQIIAFLSDNNWDVRAAGADVLSKLSKQGEMSKLLVLRY